MELRSATLDDIPLLEGIENAADQMLVERLGATDWPPAASGDWRARQPGFLLVIGRPAFGFAHVLEVEGEAHLEQLAVHPAHQRTGAGTALVRGAMAEAARRGHRSLSLRTFLDVPWNAPLYTRLGFVAEEPRTPYQLRRLREETDEGFMEYGPRVLMRAVLDGV